jgi:hypothetical protein
MYTGATRELLNVRPHCLPPSAQLMHTEAVRENQFQNASTVWPEECGRCYP